MSGWLKGILGRITGAHEAVDWEEVEAALWQSDLGAPTATAILASLRSKGLSLHSDNVLEEARVEAAKFLPERGKELTPSPDGPIVILMVGVNGTGKTTSSAKLAALLKSREHSVLLCAADTFRAAAVEQLKAWGDRLGVEVVSSEYGADPAALCHDALAKAKRLKSDFLICDTAGRLHTKSNLMQELSKIKRSLGKIDPSSPHEVFLVVDTTTGSNAVVQAREFHAATPLTGLILTKLDGSGKGGVAVAIARETGISPRYIGTGEGAGDLALFDRSSFLDRML
ncbi:MAG: signal recognition particle-docking protein FtsY [Verrucomicrobiota bacterium]|jgi:fused signal recognition particle receptor